MRTRRGRHGGAILHKDGPTMMVLSRQSVPTLDRTDMAPASELHKGAYILTETKGKTPDVILIATGSELMFAVGAKPELEKKGHAVRVVSMPGFEILSGRRRLTAIRYCRPTIASAWRSRPGRRCAGISGSASRAT